MLLYPSLIKPPSRPPPLLHPRRDTEARSVGVTVVNMPRPGTAETQYVRKPRHIKPKAAKAETQGQKRKRGARHPFAPSSSVTRNAFQPTRR